MSGCCGGNCGCGPSCGCGNGCGGCKMSPDVETAATVGVKPMVLAAPSTKASAGGFEAAVEGGGCGCNTCNCGTGCGSCTCCSGCN